MLKPLTPSQKRELRAWLSDSGKNPEIILQNPGMARRAWLDYQAASKASEAPIVASVPMSPNPSQPVLERRGRGPGRKPAGELYSVRLPADLLEDYRLLSLAEDCPVSTLIRRALKEYLADLKALGALEQC